MVAEDVSEFFSKRLLPRRVAANDRRWAISIWLLVLLSGLAWAVIFATGLVLQKLVF